MTLSPEGPNAEQIRYWNEVAGPKWVRLQERLDAQIGPFGERAIERSGAAPGECVLDVGCGCGSTALELSRRVAPTGRVVGVDLSAPMLEVARARAAPGALRFENADAQTHAFERGGFDLVFSRFGVMFFQDPPAAFSNLRSALRPGGRLTFVCWQALERNPWMAVPLRAIAAHVELPPRPGPEAPGPFALADPERIRAILERAGFRAIECEPLEQPLLLGGPGVSLDEVVAFALQLGPAAAAIRAAGEEVASRVGPAVRAALEPHATAGGVRMDAAAWIVSARRG